MHKSWQKQPPLPNLGHITVALNVAFYVSWRTKKVIPCRVSPWSKTAKSDILLYCREFDENLTLVSARKEYCPKRQTAMRCLMETQPYGFSDLWMNSPETPPMFVRRSLRSGGTEKRFQAHNSAIVQRCCTINKQLSCYPVTEQEVGHERDVARRHYACETLPQRVKSTPPAWKAPSPRCCCVICGVGSWS